MSVALVKIQIRNDTAQAWAAANPVLSDGEPGAESNTGRLKIGNGVDRWTDLSYVGGDGSGGGGSVNPISGTIDGGIFTGNPRTSEATPPFQPAASKVYVNGVEALVVSWGPSYVADPTSASIIYYAVEYTLTPSDGASWVYGGQSNVAGDTVENYAQVVAPTPIDPSNEYYYRVKAVLSNGGNGEWGYSPAYRHFKSVEPISFSLSATRTNVGSTGADNSTVISVENLTGGGPALQGPVWTYPEVTGINYIEDGAILSLENTNGTNTVNQSLFIQCMYTTPDSASEVQTIQINISNTSVDPGPGPEPTPGDTLPVFNWELVENSAEEPPGLVEIRKNSWALQELVSTGQSALSYPEGWYPSYEASLYCGNSTDPGSCLLEQWEDDPVCGLNRTASLEFTDFTLLMNCIAGSPIPPTGTLPETIDGVKLQYKKLSIANGAGCSNVPLNMNTSGGLVGLEIPNPLYYFNYVDNGGQQWATKRSYYGSYQMLDQVTINGVTASYLLLVPQNDAINSALGFAQMTGMLIKTFDGGSTFQYVDPRGEGVTQVNLGDEEEPTAIAQQKNKLPWMMLKAKSVTNGREVLVAVFNYTTSAQGVVQQFYYTDDHIVWNPCTNEEILTDTVDKVWTDPATGITYATDATHFGVLNAGVCSFYKSEPS